MDLVTVDIFLLLFYGGKGSINVSKNGYTSLIPSIYFTQLVL